MDNYLLYIVMSVLLIILPGPDTGLLMKNTVTIGKTGGYGTILGISMALLVHIMAAVLGLSAIIVNSAAIYSVLKYVGALYLIYLGVTTLMSIRQKVTVQEQSCQAVGQSEQSHTSAEVYLAVEHRQEHSPVRQGFLTNLLNPKVAVFFLTFLPQFVSGGNQSPLPFLLLGCTYLVLTIIWFSLFVMLLNQIGVWLKQPSVQRAIQAVSGIILLLFGIRLALEKN